MSRLWELIGDCDRLARRLRLYSGEWRTRTFAGDRGPQIPAIALSEIWRGASGRERRKALPGCTRSRFAYLNRCWRHDHLGPARSAGVQRHHRELVAEALTARVVEGRATKPSRRGVGTWLGQCFQTHAG